MNEKLRANLKDVDSAKLPLTIREVEIVDLLKNKNSLKDISEIFCISPTTVSVHLHNLRMKLEVSKTVDIPVKYDELYGEDFKKEKVEVELKKLKHQLVKYRTLVEYVKLRIKELEGIKFNHVRGDLI